MKEQLFRQKSLEKVTSPEQLKQYIRVSNPGIWMLLSAIAILLVGVVVWGYVAQLETTLPTAIIAKDGEGIVYISEDNVQKLSKGMIIRSGDTEYTVEEISAEAVLVDGSFSEYAVYASGLTEGQWVYGVKISGMFADGVHKAEIVLESISPISFILN